MGDVAGDLRVVIQKKYWKLIEQLAKQAIGKRLTKQLQVNFRQGEIVDVRENNIIVGASVLDFYLEKD